jgi:hypothetical protein
MATLPMALIDCADYQIGGGCCSSSELKPAEASRASPPDGRRTFWAQQTAPKPHFLANCVG